jgi:hypothetical protein
MGSLVLAVCAGTANAQLWSENFEDGTAGWSSWQQRGTLSGTTTANENPDLGTPAWGGANETMAWVHGSNFNGGIYMAVGGLPTGVDLTIDGWWRSAPATNNTMWAEVLVLEGNVALSNSSDYTTPLLWKDDNFGGDLTWDGQISATADIPAGSGIFQTASGTVTVLLKAGSTNTGDDRGTYFDDIYITPEPACLGLFALAGLVMFRRRRA